MTVQLFISSEPASLTRSQELPKRLTQDIGAPTITLSSSAPSAPSTSTHCNGSEVPVIASLGDGTCEPMYKCFDPVTVVPQEDEINASESFAIETLEAALSSSVGPASTRSQNTIVLQPTASTSQSLVSALLISPSSTPYSSYGPQNSIIFTDGTQGGEPLSIEPMDVLREQNVLGGDVEGNTAFPPSAEGSPEHPAVASAVVSAAVAPSIEVTLPMDQHESVRTSLESPSAPFTNTKASVETQDAPTSLSLEPIPSNSSRPLNSFHSNSADHNRPKHKLASPFRSPLKSKKIRDENLPPSSPMESPTTARLDNTDKQPFGRFLIPPIPPKKPEFTLDPHIKNNSTRAAKSAFKPPTFKSPLRASPATPTTSQSLVTHPPSPVPMRTASTPIWTPSDNRSATALTIQTLERRLTLLKRAIKIKSEHEGEEKLADLTRKWKDVARDVSWELWAIVKQNNEDGVPSIVEECGLFAKPNDGNGFRGKSRSGWGWDDSAKGESSTDRNAECTEEEEHLQEGDVEKEDEPENKLTMSVMLRQLGIAESTLGWDEAEGDFKVD